MLADHTQLWQLLRSLDDPTATEIPAGYHHRRERARFELLAQRLDACFGGACQVDRHVEDASLHGRIDIPAPVTRTGHPLVVAISNFGALAILAVDNPGVWTDAEAAELLDAADYSCVSNALGELGYTLIPEEPLWDRYDGTRPFSDSFSWWDRFFDYL
jgi:hypothetical protein